MNGLILLLSLTFFQVSHLSNADVVQMTQAGLSPETIVAKIKVSRSAFDTSPSALADLKSKGVAESVLVAMIATQNPPDQPTTSNTNAKEAAIKALRRLANAVEVGVSFVDYGPLVIEAKTELESALEKLPEDAFSTAASRALAEYQFAVEVWYAHRTCDTIYGYYHDIAIKQYGVAKTGWLVKMVSRNDFLRAIWREARRHYEASIVADQPSSKPNTPSAMLQGRWWLQPTDAASTPGPVLTWTLTVFDGAAKVGHLHQGKADYPIRRIALEGGRFHIETKGKGEPILDFVIKDNRIEGTITIQKDNRPVTYQVIGMREPNP
jgi:hypothetical protein